MPVKDGDHTVHDQSGTYPSLGDPLPLAGSQAQRLAKVFKALSDPVRLRLLSLIASHPGGEVCVCNLVDAFNVTQPAISHHLKVLRDADLVTSERRGPWAYYSMRTDAFPALRALFGPSAQGSLPAEMTFMPRTTAS